MSGDDREGSEFRRALSDAKPLPGREKVEAPPQQRPPKRTARGARIRFELETRGERHEGRAAGIDVAHLQRLRRGEVAIDRRVDLHGLDSSGAGRLVRTTLEAAAAAGERCVLIVHGRGAGSPAGPVLKSALPGWLTEPPLSARVMAFASAAPRDGGPGATYVLLRRTRPPRRRYPRTP